MSQVSAGSVAGRKKKGGTGDGRVRDLLICVAGPPGKNRPATEGRGTGSGRTEDLRRKNRGPAAKKQWTGDGKTEDQQRKVGGPATEGRGTCDTKLPRTGNKENGRKSQRSPSV